MAKRLISDEEYRLTPQDGYQGGRVSKSVLQSLFSPIIDFQRIRL
jgi:hypothetical protein